MRFAAFVAIVGSSMAIGNFACGGDDDVGPASGVDGGGDAGGGADGPASPPDGSTLDPACTDGMKSAGETDVDCGGKCAPCVTGKTCAADGDCAGGACEQGVCAPTSVCYDNGFCWESPTPTGDQLNGVWAASTADVWMVGGTGSIIRWNGKRFIVHESGTREVLNGVSGFDATHVWAVGDKGTIRAWDGTKWSAQTSGVTTVLFSVFALDAQHAWAVGLGVVLAWNGSTWSAVSPAPTPTILRSVWASSATDVWAVGDNTIVHFDGLDWKTETTGLSSASGVWGAGADVWAANGSGVYKRDGTSWTPDGTGISGSVKGGWAKDATHAVVFSDDQLWMRAGSSTWAFVDAPDGYYRHVFGTAANDIWAVGAWGTIQHFASTEWKPRAPSLPRRSVLAVAGSSPSNVLATNGGTMFRRKGASWVEEPFDDGDSPATAYGLYTSDSNNAVAATSTGIRRWNGAAWSKEDVPGLTGALRAVAGHAPNLLWAVGNDGQIAKWDGMGWSIVPSGTTKQLDGVWAADANNAWAVGADGTILRFDGVSWQPESSNVTARLRAVWGSDASNVFVAADYKALRRMNGTWSELPAPSGVGELDAVAGHAPNDVWFGAFNNGVFHWDGVSVTRVSAPELAIYGAASVGASTFLVGYEGSILHRP